MTRAAGWAVRAVSLVLALAVLVGCGATPSRVGESGIDGLTIPTPSPDPADFGRRVDNPWFPLRPGTEWTYRHYTPYGSQVLTATVLARPREVAGVATTAVRWQVVRHGRGATTAVRWYAEDRAGNVWWLGQRVRRSGPSVDALADRSWLAGQDGAEAGLVIAAAPRVGDGYANVKAPGVLERRSTVLSLTATVATPRRTYADAVLTRDTGSRHPTLVVQTFFVSGIGVVSQQSSDVTTSDLTLVRVQR